MAAPGSFQITVTVLQDIVRSFSRLEQAVTGAVGQAWGVLAERSVAPDSGSLALDLSTGFNFGATLDGATFIDNPINAKPGQSGAVFLTQGGGGSISFGSAWKFAGGGAPSLTGAAGAVDVLQYRVRALDFIVATFIGDAS